MSLNSRIARIAAAAVAAIAIFLMLTLVMRVKDAPAVSAGKAPTADAGPPSGAGTAAARLHEAMALAAELEKKPNHVPILFRLAQLARENGKPAEGIPHLRKILEVEPKNTKARLELGRSLYDVGDVPAAIVETNRILVDDPKN